MSNRRERQKAQSEAFVKAKEEAAELAKAAGVELGPLVGLSGGGSAQTRFGENPCFRYGGPDVVRPPIAEPAGESSGEKQDEAMGPDPSALKFNCTVAAMFQLGK